MDTLRRIVASALALIGGAAPLVSRLVIEIWLPTVVRVGGFGATMWHLLLMVPLTLILGGVSALMVMAGARLWFHKNMSASYMFIAIYSPVAAWAHVDLANRALERAAPVARTTSLVSWELPRKGQPSIEVTDWTDPTSTISLEVYPRESERIKGSRVTLMEHHGALGLRYAEQIEIHVK
ncbi:MAG: hypothetical protein U0165_12485 [Polyangiaceae bacterium]